MVGENRLLEISHSRGFVRSTETSTASTMLNRRVGNVQMRFFFFFFFFLNLNFYSAARTTGYRGGRVGYYALCLGVLHQRIEASVSWPHVMK
jgi:hypothetical protein